MWNTSNILNNRCEKNISKNVISQQSDEIESVDMRYDKGFTILWKNVPLAS